MPYSDEKIKVLGQISPNPGALTEIYAVPSGKDAVISSIVVTNRDPTTPDVFFVSIAINNAADNVKQYVYYGVDIPNAETFVATVGFSLSSNDRIRVQSTNGTLSFNIFGSEITYF